jgi:hypothetical protein
LQYKIQPIVIAVLVRDQNDIRRIGIITRLIRINIDDFPFRGFDFDGGVPQIRQRSEDLVTARACHHFIFLEANQNEGGKQ